MLSIKPNCQDRLGTWSRAGILRELQWNRDWVEKQTHRDWQEDDSFRAQNLLVGCTHLLNQAGAKLGPWLDHRESRRAPLKRIGTAYSTRRGRKALLDLIDHTAGVFTVAA